MFHAFLIVQSMMSPFELHGERMNVRPPIDIQKQADNFYERRKKRLGEIKAKNLANMQQAIADKKPASVIDALKGMDETITRLLQQNERIRSPE